MMRHAPPTYTEFTDTEIVPTKSPLVPQARKSIFAVIIEALPYSRRLQAKRVLRADRDLIDAAQRSIFREFRSREEAERCWRDLGSGRHPSLSDR
jgi:hypothetical protein